MRLCAVLSVEKNFSRIRHAGCRQEIQKRRFSASACADNRVGLPSIKYCTDPAQNFGFSVIAEPYVLEPKLTHQRRDLDTVRLHFVLLQRVCQLGNQAPRGFSRCKKRRQLRDRLDHEVHQIDKQNDRARRQTFSRQRQIRARQKHAQLRNDSGGRADPAHQRLEPAAAEFFLLQRAVALGKQAEDLLFRPESLDDGKSAETVGECCGKVAVLVGDSLFRGLQLPARQ